MNFYNSLPESYTVTVNYQHPVIKKIIDEKNESLSGTVAQIGDKLAEPKSLLVKINEKTGKLKEEEIDRADKDEKEKLESEIEKLEGERKEIMSKFGKENDLIRQVCDLALLSNGMLKGEDLSRFVKRSLSLIK
jgi:molecular chaperone HtpG